MGGGGAKSGMQVDADTWCRAFPNTLHFLLCCYTHAKHWCHAFIIPTHSHIYVTFTPGTSAEHDLTSSQFHAMAQEPGVTKPVKKRITPIPIDQNSAGTFGSTAAHGFGAPFGYAAQKAPSRTLGSDAAAPGAGQEAQHAQHHQPDEDSPCVQTPGRRMRVCITPEGDGCFMLDYRQVRPMVDDLGTVACSRQQLGLETAAACMLVRCWQCISPACFFKPAARQGEQGGRCCCSKEKRER